MRTFFAIGLTLLALPTASAAETSWYEVAPDVRVRLVSSDLLAADGTTLVALEIDMPEDVKTYWRVPGETGIPTELDLAGSQGIAGHRMLWPYPTVDTSTGFVDYAYYGPTVLPIQLEVEGKTPIVQASVVMGVCSDICIPVNARFSLPLQFERPDLGQKLRINQALAETPVTWSDPREPVGAVSYDAGANALLVALADPDLDALSVIADTGDLGVLIGAPQKSPDGRVIRLPLLGNSKAEGLEGKPVQLTFMTPVGPFEMTRVVSAPGTVIAGQ